ncbi:DUF4870 domain-containing protein [Leifsonia sp. 1010]|uniref:DUF4870 domain-containing protein n=1 Tax=Leifsonia sp. 1010 TaxID=2817769 RepID=UPI0028617B53|nr:DUF4870 domain-containing protein [Leifsonia sp. 1010]MDR6611914.1 putative Tic20 family protein [Leifsonia sp. 1010]
MSTAPDRPQPNPQPAAHRPDEWAASDQRLWAMLVHLGGILLGWLAPLLGLLLLTDRGAFVRRHVVTALNFQLTLFLAALVGYMLSIVAIGLLLLLAVFVVNVVFSIIAALKANQGAEYVYPLAIRFVR